MKNVLRTYSLASLGVLLGSGSLAFCARGAPLDVKVGASGPSPCDQVAANKWHCRTGTGWQVCAADASVTCIPPAIQAPVDGGIENLTLLTDFQATGVTCDSGFPCVGVIRKYMPGMNAGGIFVTPEWGSSDTPISNDLSGPLLGSTANIQYGSGQPAGTMFCPIASVVSCDFDIDFNLPYPVTIPDSGSDAADAADAADATDAADAADAAVDAGTPGFTLSGIYIQPAVPTGSTPNLVVVCTAGASACTTVTSATICGTPATVAATSTTSITLTPPSNTETAGATCTITATNTNGTYTLPGCPTGSTCATGLGVLNSGFTHGYYEPQGWNVGAQTWADFIASAGNLAESGATHFTTTASWSSGQPAVTIAVTTSQLFNTTLAQAQPFSILQALNITGTLATAPFTWEAVGSVCGERNLAANLELIAPTIVTASAAPTYTTPYWQESTLNGSSSLTAVNTVTTTAASTPGANGITGGISLFNNVASNEGMIGSQGLILVFAGSITPTIRSNSAYVALAIYGNGMHP